MTARAVGGSEDMCERKASSDLMSVMVDIMRMRYGERLSTEKEAQGDL